MTKPKPSDFILNSDYLSIAQVSRDEFSISFNSGTLTPAGSTSGSYREFTTDFTTHPQAGAVNRVMIKKNDGEWQSCTYMRIDILTSNEPYTRIVGFFAVFKVSKNTFRTQLVLENSSSNTATYPAMTFRVKVSSFKPPNIF